MTLGVERRAEDGLVEARIARVQHGVGLDPRDQIDQLLPVGGVDALGGEARRLAEARNHRAHALGRHVGEHHPLERGPTLGDRRKRRSHAAGSDHENPHPGKCYANQNPRQAQASGVRAPLCSR